MAAEKIFISANDLLADSFRLGMQVLDSGFKPTHLVGIWRGGAPVGIAVQELLDYHGQHCDHIAIRTSSYHGIDKQDAHVSQIFEKMADEINSDYQFKYDLLRNYTMELIHYALKMQPSESLYQHPNANSRITSVFTELLERQFPIESPSQRFTLRSANDFANKLSVHVNHLNRAIRETTGKTTTHHIAERITSEAMALLKHTNWNIAEISYSLGFEEPAHFNNFFKKHTSQTPSSFRVV